MKNSISVTVKPKKTVMVNQSGLIAARRLSDLLDVDVSVKEDGYTLVYDEVTGKFKSSKLLDAVEVIGGTGITTAVANNSVIISLDDTAVTPGEYGSSTQIPIFTVDAQGRITAADVVAVATDLSIAGDSGTDKISLITDVLNFSGGTGVSTSVANTEVTFSIGQDVATTADVTFNNGIFNGSLFANTEITTGDIVIRENIISTAEANTSLVLQSGSYISASGAIIKDAADPQAPGDVANKRYVDAVALGLNILPAAKVATTGDLGATYSDGPNPENPGVDATLTIPPTAILTIDGISEWSIEDNILVKDQTNAPENGSYNITQIGDDTTPWILTRNDFDDEPFQIRGSFEFVSEGNQYASTGWVATAPNANSEIVVGQDDIIWVQFSGVGTFLAGDGLDLDGNIFSVNVDNSSIEIFDDILRVKSFGVTNEMLFGSIDNTKLTNSSINFAAETGTTDAVFLGETVTFAAGEGINTAVANNTITVSGENASNTNKGIASFSMVNFVVNEGAVSIYEIDGGTY